MCIGSPRYPRVFYSRLWLSATFNCALYLLFAINNLHYLWFICFLEQKMCPLLSAVFGICGIYADATPVNNEGYLYLVAMTWQALDNKWISYKWFQITQVRNTRIFEYFFFQKLTSTRVLELKTQGLIYRVTTTTMEYFIIVFNS